VSITGVPVQSGILISIVFLSRLKGICIIRFDIRGRESLVPASSIDNISGFTVYQDLLDIYSLGLLLTYKYLLY